MEVIMKSIFIDTNFVNDNGTLRINEFMIDNLRLQNGERVLAYQEEDFWEAEIVYEDNVWSVKLLSDAKNLSKERQIGHEEGFQNGCYVQSMRLLHALQNLGYSAEEIEKVKQKLGLN